MLEGACSLFRGLRFRGVQIGIANVYFAVSARLRIGETFETYGIRPFLKPSTRTSGVINLGCRFLGSAFLNVLQCFPRNAVVTDFVSVTRSKSHMIPDFVSKMDHGYACKGYPYLARLLIAWAHLKNLLSAMSSIVLIPKASSSNLPSLSDTPPIAETGALSNCGKFRPS